MKRVTHLLFSTLILLVLLAVMFETPASAALKSPTLRMFYVTPAAFPGNAALTACSTGYHMASIFEVLDVSNLRYDTTLGFTVEDSGSGPPQVLGWIRTGTGSSGNSAVGLGNCQAWTSNASTDNGTIAAPALYFLWPNNSLSSTINPWGAITESCDQSIRVWCVQD